MGPEAWKLFLSLSHIAGVSGRGNTGGSDLKAEKDLRELLAYAIVEVGVWGSSEAWPERSISKMRREGE